MKKVLFPVAALILVIVGILAIGLASTPASARSCVQCPVIEDPTCPPCYSLVPGTCTHCAYCKHIAGCHK